MKNMLRRKFLNSLGGATGLLMASPLLAGELKAQACSESKIGSELPGVWKFTVGTPEKITPQSIRTIKPSTKRLQELPAVDRCPVGILPLAQPTLHTDDPDSYKLTAFVFGENAKQAILFEDNGNLNAEILPVKLEWNNGQQNGRLVREGKVTSPQYSVSEWKLIN